MMSFFRPKPTISIRNFSIGTDELDRATVIIGGRTSGLIGLVCSLLRLGTTTELKVDRSWASYSTNELFSFLHTELPVRQIKSVSYGHTRRVYGLVICFAAAAWIGFGLAYQGYLYGLIPAALLVLLGLLHLRSSRRYFISLDSGGSPIVLYAKQSKVGGTSVNAASIRQAAEAIRSLIC